MFPHDRLLWDRVADTPPQTADWWDMNRRRTQDVLSGSGIGSATVRALTLRQRRKATLASSWVIRLSSLHQLMSSPCSSSTDLIKAVCVAADRWASAPGSVKRATTFTINQLRFNYNVFGAFNEEFTFEQRVLHRRTFYLSSCSHTSSKRAQLNRTSR